MGLVAQGAAYCSSDVTEMDCLAQMAAKLASEGAALPPCFQPPASAAYVSTIAPAASKPQMASGDVEETAVNAKEANTEEEVPVPAPVEGSAAVTASSASAAETEPVPASVATVPSSSMDKASVAAINSEKQESAPKEAVDDEDDDVIAASLGSAPLTPFGGSKSASKTAALSASKSAGRNASATSTSLGTSPRISGRLAFGSMTSPAKTPSWRSSHALNTSVSSNSSGASSGGSSASSTAEDDPILASLRGGASSGRSSIAKPAQPSVSGASKSSRLSTGGSVSGTSPASSVSSSASGSPATLMTSSAAMSSVAARSALLSARKAGRASVYAAPSSSSGALFSPSASSATAGGAGAGYAAIHSAARMRGIGGATVGSAGDHGAIASAFQRALTEAIGERPPRQASESPEVIERVQQQQEEGDDAITRLEAALGAIPSASSSAPATVVSTSHMTDENVDDVANRRDPFAGDVQYDPLGDNNGAAAGADGNEASPSSKHGGGKDNAGDAEAQAEDVMRGTVVVLQTVPAKPSTARELGVETFLTPVRRSLRVYRRQLTAALATANSNGGGALPAVAEEGRREEEEEEAAGAETPDVSPAADAASSPTTAADGDGSYAALALHASNTANQPGAAAGRGGKQKKSVRFAAGADASALKLASPAPVPNVGANGSGSSGGKRMNAGHAPTPYHSRQALADEPAEASTDGGSPQLRTALGLEAEHDDDAPERGGGSSSSPSSVSLVMAGRTVPLGPADTPGRRNALPREIPRPAPLPDHLNPDLTAGAADEAAEDGVEMLPVLRPRRLPLASPSAATRLSLHQPIVANPSPFMSRLLANASANAGADASGIHSPAEAAGGAASPDVTILPPPMRISGVVNYLPSVVSGGNSATLASNLGVRFDEVEIPAGGGSLVVITPRASAAKKKQHQQQQHQLSNNGVPEEVTRALVPGNTLSDVGQLAWVPNPALPDVTLRAGHLYADGRLPF